MPPVKNVGEPCAEGSSRQAATHVSSVLADRIAEQLRCRMLGEAITIDDVGYDAARRVWNGAIDKHPRSSRGARQSPTSSRQSSSHVASAC